MPARPYRFETDRSTVEIRATHGGLPPDTRTDDRVRVAGRLELVRRQGGLTFAVLVRAEHGGVETRYRRRYADLIADERTREIFRIRHGDPRGARAPGGARLHRGRGAGARRRPGAGRRRARS